MYTLFHFQLPLLPINTRNWLFSGGAIRHTTVCCAVFGPLLCSWSNLLVYTSVRLLSCLPYLLFELKTRVRFISWLGFRLARILYYDDVGRTCMCCLSIYMYSQYVCTHVYIYMLTEDLICLWPYVSTRLCVFIMQYNIYMDYIYTVA